MDPLTAISLASAVVQFVDFGSKIVVKGYDIHQSVDGVSSYNQKLKESIDRADALCAELSKSSPSGVSTAKPSTNERAIHDTSKQCIDIAGELRAALLKLQANPKSFSSSLRKAFKSVWSEKDIRTLETRLAKIRSELQLHLIATLRDGQSVTMKTLNAISKYQVLQYDRNKADLLALKQDVLTAIDAFSSKAAITPANLDQLATKLADLSQTSTIALQRHRLLKSLYFDSMHDRERTVEDKHENTFEWMFDESHALKPLHLSTWLQKEKGIFWVSGRAGSGKSTFMKALSNNDRTKVLLGSWAGGDNVVLSKYFFWNAGSRLQKSQEGLLRTILFEILSLDPDLAPGVYRALPKSLVSTLELDYTECQWSLKDLLSGFSHLVSNSPKSTRFCVFLDGLDEYDGEPRELTKFLKQIADLENIKICLSSRDWPAFDAEFGKDSGVLSLALHEHTKEDIRLYIHDVLEEDSLFAKLRNEDERYDRLVESLVAKAQGVFLWIFLIVRDISNNLPNKDSFQDLQRRIDQFPDHLDVYFMRMLDSVQPIYEVQSAEILLVCLLGCRAHILSFRYFMEDRRERNKAETRFIPLQEWQSMRDLTVTHIKARVPDILNVVELQDRILYTVDRVDFLHRTVYDFLRRDHIYQILRKRVRPDFHPGIALCKAYLFELKSTPTFTYEDPQPEEVDDFVAVNVSKFLSLGEDLVQHGLTDQETVDLFAVFDEYEQVLSQLSHQVQELPDKMRPISNFGLVGSMMARGEIGPGIIFLGEAIAYQFDEYVMYRFERDPQLVAYLSPNLSTLEFVLRGSRGVMLSEPSFRILKFVLSKYPEAIHWNAMDGNGTVWGSHVAKLEGKTPSWGTAIVIITLVRADADLDYPMEHENGQISTAFEVIRGSIPPEYLEELDKLYAAQCSFKRELAQPEEQAEGQEQTEGTEAEWEAEAKEETKAEDKAKTEDQAEAPTAGELTGLWRWFT